ncbi:MFS family permease [Mesorhizobium abyssinicae]
MVGHGHSVGSALGIQWHVLSIFGPRFVTGRLMARFGKEHVAAVGLLLIGGSALVALSGLDIVHFWGALILLGIGWNFGFVGAKAMVADRHSPSERSKVQGANDFMVFGIVACASFFAGSLLHSSGWGAINRLVPPAAALILVPLIWREAHAATVDLGALRAGPTRIDLVDGRTSMMDANSSIGQPVIVSVSRAWVGCHAAFGTEFEQSPARD